MNIVDIVIRSMVADRDKEILDFFTINKNKRSFSNSAKKEISYEMSRQYGNPFKNCLYQIPPIEEFNPFVSEQRLYILRPPKFIYELYSKDVGDRLIFSNLESVGIEEAIHRFIGLRYPPIKKCTNIGDIRITIPFRNKSN